MHQMFYILPSIGISAGGQFFVFFQMFFAYTSDISDVRGEDSKTKFTRFLIAEVRSQPDTQGQQAMSDVRAQSTPGR